MKDDENAQVDPEGQLRLASQAAGRAVERIVAPWWIYVVSGALWSAVFAVMLGGGQFWVFSLALVLGIPFASWLRVQATGVRISDRLRWNGMDVYTGAWILGAFGFMVTMVLLGNVVEGLFGWPWALWVAGALIGPFFAVAEWKTDLRTREILRGRR